MFHNGRKNMKRKGISTVLTTLIIVVASVVLGTAVTLFGTSMFQTGAEQQSISVTNLHVWYHNDTYSEGAAAVRNTGDKVVAVDTIAIRGAVVPFENWAYVDNAATSLFQSDLQFCNNMPTNTCDVDGDSSDETLVDGNTGAVALQPGEAIIVYFRAPDGTFSAFDIGGSTSLKVGSGSLVVVQYVPVSDS